MSIKISSNCIGCGKCAEVCPGSLIELQGGKAEIPRPERCWGCVSCVKECPVQAILFYLGKDIGGQSSTMTVRREGKKLHWRIAKPDGALQTITVDSGEANQY